MQLRPIALLLFAVLASCDAEDMGPLEVEVSAAQQEPITWIFAHMKLVVIIGGAISAAGLVLIFGLTLVDCLMLSRAVVPVEGDGDVPVEAHARKSKNKPGLGS